MPAATHWNDVANSPRWRGLVAFIRNWIGPFNATMGMNAEEVDAILKEKGLNLPAAVREWQILAGGWEPVGEIFWTRTSEFELRDGMVLVLSDRLGAGSWTIRKEDLGNDDPPVWSVELEEVSSPTFSTFVAAMTINETLFSDDITPQKLNSRAVPDVLTCLLSSKAGSFWLDAPLEKATVAAFMYPNDGPALGKARTSHGQAVLEGLAERHTGTRFGPG